MKHKMLLFSTMVLLLSCGNKTPGPDTRYQPFVKEVEEKKQRLPIKIADGFTQTNVEYKDSTYSVWLEVDDNRSTLASLDSLLQMYRKTLLYNAIMSEGQIRRNWEIYVENNIRIHIIYSRANYQNQVETIITPSEINECLHTIVDDYTKLKMFICRRNLMIQEKENGGVIGPVTSLKDSVIYISFISNEAIHDPIELKNNVNRTNLIENIFHFDPEMIIYAANANCGLCMRFIGSQSKKTADIYISPKEILKKKNLLVINAKKSRIVESDI